jgi:ribosomal protein S18 acetylase RimI-like enzyme
MFQVKNMTEQDLPFSVQVTDQMNWGMIEDDFRFVLELEPEGCFILFDGKERVGIATTVSYGKIGWFGNLIVAESQRGKGAGSLLVKHSMEYLKSRGVETVGLYAYTNKLPFYRRLGFEYDSNFSVLTGKGFSSPEEPSVTKARRHDVQQIIDCDSSCFGASRRKVLESILDNPNNLGYVLTEERKMVGFALAKVWGSIAVLGPLVCPLGHNDVPNKLLKTLLNELEGSEISLCLPEKERSIINMLMSHGFVKSFDVARMFFHPKPVNDCVYLAESLERG